MKRYRSHIIIVTLMFLTLAPASGQLYGTGFGVLLGNPAGATIKMFFSERDAFEGIIATSWSGVTASAHYQHHFKMSDPKLRNTHWYLGAGIQAGRWDNTAPFYEGSGHVIPVGIGLAAGMESTFGDYPFTFGFHVMPSVNLIGHFSLNIFQAGITGRYVF
ncbi:MAG: hypothetical protein EA408_10485 [Marinilabiliales bacterium]|nr:MAG: hypothetical protein EA408_10485 [Marinilabiliales bacterium]